MGPGEGPTGKETIVIEYSTTTLSGDLGPLQVTLGYLLVTPIGILTIVDPGEGCSA
jgi:hypothetical protein